jgi:nicotinamide mononucleotide transporter
LIRELSIQLHDAWRGTGWMEMTAAVLAVLYLLLAIRQRLSCWVAAFISSCLYVVVMFGARLYMESVLNAFYAVMAAYGWWQWRGGGDKGERGAPVVRRWPLARHAAGLLGIVVLASVNWYFLSRFTQAASPFVDSMVTWSSVFATFLVARKVYENWYWWLIIDSVSLCLYYLRHLYLTVLLFALYLIMIIIGMRQWSRSLSPQPNAAG